jgi:hypothetical protein
MTDGPAVAWRPAALAAFNGKTALATEQASRSEVAATNLSFVICHLSFASGRQQPPYLAYSQEVTISTHERFHRLRHKLCFHLLPPRRLLFGSQAELPLSPPNRARIKIKQQSTKRKEDEMPR